MAKKPKKVVDQVTDAEATTEAVEVAEQAIAVARSRGPRGVLESAVITVLAEANPKRAGSKAEGVFAHYTTGMTVAEFCDAVGKEATPNLVYDAAHGFISIEGYDPAKVVLKEKVAKAPKEPKAPRTPKAKKERAVVEPSADQAELEGLVVEESLD